MIVSPELISASSAPDASPLNNCETKLGQVIMRIGGPDQGGARTGTPAR